MYMYMEIYLPKDPYKPKLSSTLQLIEVYCLSTLYSTEVSNSSSLPVFIAFSEFQHGARDENKPFTITGSEVENIAPATVGDSCCEPRRQHLDTETQPRMCTCIYPCTYDVCVVRLFFSKELVSKELGETCGDCRNYFLL